MTDESAGATCHNEQENRFETSVSGRLAIAEYVRQGDEITFTHTKVPEPHEGQGIGQSLAKAALDFALQENLTVVAQCPFIAAVVEQHPEYQRLVKPNASS